MTFNAPVVPTGQPDRTHAAAAPSRALAEKSGNRRTRTDAAVQLRKFFADNPDEELSAEDASVKFGVSLRRAGNILAALCGQGMLQRTSIYRVKES